MKKFIEKLKANPVTTTCGLIIGIATNLALVDQLADYKGIFLCVSGLATIAMGYFASDATEAK